MSTAADGEATGAIEGTDWIRTCGDTADDKVRLERFLNSVTPGGVTPLAERVHALSQRFNPMQPGQLAFFVIITDGAPTSLTSGTPTQHAARAALTELRQLTMRLPVRLVVRLCTDEDSAVDFWNNADAEEELPLDVLDDITAEAKEIADCGNNWLAYTPALHMLRESGTLVGLLDLLDERRLRPGEAATLASLLLQSDDLDSADWPDWQHSEAAFRAHLQAKCSAAGNGYDVRLRRNAPIVNASLLYTAMRRAGWGGPLAMLRDYVSVLVVLVAIVLLCASRR